MPANNNFPLNPDGQPIRLPTVSIKAPRIKKKPATSESSPSVPADEVESVINTEDVLSDKVIMGVADVATRLVKLKKYPTLYNDDELRENIAKNGAPKPKTFFQPKYDAAELAIDIASNPTPIGVGIAIAKQLVGYDMMGEVEGQLAYMRETQIYEEERSKNLSEAHNQSMEIAQKKLASESEVLRKTLEAKMSSKIQVLESKNLWKSNSNISKKGKSPYTYQWNDRPSVVFPVKLSQGNAMISPVQSLTLPKKGEAWSDTIVPKSLWQDTNILGGYAAGLIDGIYAELKGLVDIGELGYEVSKTLMKNIADHPEKALIDYILGGGISGVVAGAIGREVSPAVRELYETLRNQPELLSEMLANIKEMFSEYLGDLLGDDGGPEAGYEWGKMTVFILSLLIGVGELKAITKGEKLGLNLRTKLKTAIARFKKLSNDSKEKIKKIIEKKIKKDIVKSNYGQKLDEIGEVINRNLVKGKYSNREFNPNRCGGKILKLNWENTKFSNEGLGIIKRHLNRFKKNGKHSKGNSKMLKRLEDILENKIQPTDYDKRFYSHELREYERYKSMAIADNMNNYELWNNAHSATLEDFQIDETKELLYHPSISEIDIFTY